MYNNNLPNMMFNLQTTIRKHNIFPGMMMGLGKRAPNSISDGGEFLKKKKAQLK